ncbi:MAG: hypothetical protein JRC87_04525 [Deltaproteobacteria bacterium]|nr:hypothetical protein [Deltaproteobacteria bacterium]
MPRGKEQVKAPGKVVVARAEVKVSRQEQAVIAFIPIVAKKRPISCPPVMTRNIPNAALS